MTLALQSTRLMLIAAILSTALMLVLWLGMGNAAAKSSAYMNGFNVIASALFMFLLPKNKKWISFAFLGFCLLLIIGSKSGGFTLTTFPAYIMTLLGFAGAGGILQSFKSEPDTIE